MGNARVQQRRLGIKRPGPSQRASVLAPDLFEGDAVVRERAAERQRQCRAKKRSLQEASHLLTTAQGEERERVVAPRDASRVANKICHFVIQEFQDCGRGPLFREAVLEAMFKNAAIAPHLPKYYSHPSEARAQHAFIMSYKKELDSLKIPTSKEKLVRKTTLLEAAVSSEVSGLRALSRVLGTKPDNISNAILRRQALQENGASIFTLAERRKRDGLPNSIKDLVVAWWTTETRVSPNKKDVTRKRLAPKVYEKHPTHLLLESEVRVHNHHIHL